MTASEGWENIILDEGAVGACAVVEEEVKRKTRKTHTTKDGRTILGPKDAAKLLDQLYERAGGQCEMPICLFEKKGYPRWMPRSLATKDHIKKCKMGGGFRDDTMENCRLAHAACNSEREAHSEAH